MSRSRKLLLSLVALGVAIFGLFRLYYHLTDDFRLSNISYKVPFEVPWSATPLTPEERGVLSIIFAQPFNYLGKGAQSYAFVSKDGQYVLKFFKFKHLKPSAFVNALPDYFPFQVYKQSCISRKARKLVGVFNGYALAFNENKDASQLLYLHLVPTTDLQLEVTVKDKLGISRNIALDDVVFLVQKKGETLRSRLSKLLDRGDVAGAKEAIDKIIAMYMDEYSRGLYDHDHGVMHNAGFINDKPFHLDVGKLNKDERMLQEAVYKEDLAKITFKIDEWLSRNYPQFAEELKR